MKKLNLIRRIILHGFGLAAVALVPILPADSASPLDRASQSQAIPTDQLGAVAGKQYQGDGLSVTATPDGARLQCAFQHLEGHVTRQGLWLNSTEGRTERFRVMAVTVGRSTQPTPLPLTGSVTVAGSVARFIRTGLTEEYSVSMDGVRQDFIVEQRPNGEGPLHLELELTGAKAEVSAKGQRLVLDGSSRKLAYSRLHVVDARGEKLTARIEVATAMRLTVVIDDAAAVYPVRVDPTFSDEDWDSMGGLLGADEFVSAAVADGAGNLYIGGYFTVVGDIRANHIAKWDGSEWSALGEGLDYSVWALAVSGTDLYVGGDFSWADEGEITFGIPVNRVAKWDGHEWSALGAGVGAIFGEFGSDDYVNALAVVGTDVYVGGYFTMAGETEVANIAKWNGSRWSALGSGTDGDVFALAVMGTDLLVGGYFTTAGEAEANNIAKWSGSAWSALGSGMDDSVAALAVAGTTLYAGGDFSAAGGNDAYYIAKWNGSAWSPLGWGVDDRVTALAVAGTDLYAGGYFSTAGDEETSAFYVAKWNGSTWSALGEGVDDYVNALAVVGTTLFVGGDFELVGGETEFIEGHPEFVGQKQAYFIAKWDGSDWSALGSGLSGFVYALAVAGTTLYAGGDFSTADVNPAENIARWDGSKWSALGKGMDAPVTALAVSGTTLYAGGQFTKAGGTAATHIARWNGSAWSALGSGMNDFGYVNALAVSGTDLYAGGDFYMAGGTEVNYVAKWNGSAWSPLGSGAPSTVNALAVVGTDLYAGGYLSLAKWGGSEWWPVGSEMNGTVYALAAVGSDLYVGGNFSTAGEIPANGIAKWNGSTWSALGSSVDGFVQALAVSGTDLYVGGYFGTAGETEVANIAKWDGHEWSALGSGMGASVYAMAIVGADLYAGGEFVSAGNKVSAHIARANIGAPPLSIRRSSTTVIISWPVTGLNFQLQVTTDFSLPNSWTAVAQLPVTNDDRLSVTLPTAVGRRFFRLRSQ